MYREEKTSNYLLQIIVAVAQNLPFVGTITTWNWPTRWSTLGRRNSFWTWLWPAGTGPSVLTGSSSAPVLHCWKRCWLHLHIRPTTTRIPCSISTISILTIWWHSSNSCTEAAWPSHNKLCPASSQRPRFSKFADYLVVLLDLFIVILCVVLLICLC